VHARIVRPPLRATCSLPAVHFDLARVVLDAAQALWIVLPGAGVPRLLQRLEGSGRRRTRADYGSWSRAQESSEPFDRYLSL
jgi:hypothetical protein